jgi:hypothetical protein
MDLYVSTVAQERFIEGGETISFFNLGIKNHHPFLMEKRWWFLKQFLYFRFTLQLFKEIT